MCNRLILLEYFVTSGWIYVDEIPFITYILQGCQTGNILCLLVQVVSTEGGAHPAVPRPVRLRLVSHLRE